MRLDLQITCMVERSNSKGYVIVIHLFGRALNFKEGSYTGHLADIDLKSYSISYKPKTSIDAK